VFALLEKKLVFVDKLVLDKYYCEVTHTLI